MWVFIYTFDTSQDGKAMAMALLCHAKLPVNNDDVLRSLLRKKNVIIDKAQRVSWKCMSNSFKLN
jgi:hypothetical protein